MLPFFFSWKKKWEKVVQVCLNGFKDYVGNVRCHNCLSTLFIPTKTSIKMFNIMPAIVKRLHSILKIYHE